MRLTEDLRQQAAEPVDEATRLAIEQAQAERRRGEGVPLEQVRDIVRQRSKECQKMREEIHSA
jgi:regulator of replication initiation timing